MEFKENDHDTRSQNRLAFESSSCQLWAGEDALLSSPPHSVRLRLPLVLSFSSISSSSHQATCQHSGWRSKFSTVGRRQVWPSPPTSRSWSCAGSWLTTSASTTRNTTAWRVSRHCVLFLTSFRRVVCSQSELICVKCFNSWSFFDHFIKILCLWHSGAHEWAQKTLRDHAKDERPYIYTREQLEKAKTHDKLWNAAQVQHLVCNTTDSSDSFLFVFMFVSYLLFVAYLHQYQMVTEGKMHGFLRMYWAKKILEWTSSPEEALSIALYLNDRYELDGQDPNGFVGENTID